MEPQRRTAGPEEALACRDQTLRLQPSALWGSRPRFAEGSQMKSEKEGFHRLALTQGGPEATGLWENTEPHW